MTTVHISLGRDDGTDQTAAINDLLAALDTSSGQVKAVLPPGVITCSVERLNPDELDPERKVENSRTGPMGRNAVAGRPASRVDTTAR